MSRVCHVSSAHVGLDVRIFHKECVSLAAAGIEVHLVIAASEEERSEAAACGVSLHRLPAPPASRFVRMLSRVYQCYRAARRVDAAVYHLHDIELLTVGTLLRIQGHRVVYDVHEDVPMDVLTKDWIPKPIRVALKPLIELFEWITARYCFDVIVATPAIQQRFERYNPNTVCIGNFPLLSEFAAVSGKRPARGREVAYVGGIAAIRGIREMVQALELCKTDVRLRLVGQFTDHLLAAELRAEPGWARVEEVGFLDRTGVNEVLQGSLVGLVTLHPVANYLEALPVKMFEYMAAGLPVIASDFPLWREIVEQSHCGLCVDPLDPKAIAEAIDSLVENPTEAEDMGRKGQEAVFQRYNWSSEEAKLLKFYGRLLKK